MGNANGYNLHAMFGRFRIARLGVAWLVVAGAASAATPTFQHDVLPLMEQKCIGCHGEQAMAGLDLRTLDAVVKGSSGGEVITPGDPEQSLLWEKIASDAMPMGMDPLTDGEKELIREWITNGLFPSRDLDAEAASAEARVREQAKSYWSFQTPTKHPAPAVAHLEQVRTPIDAFILEKLEAVGTSLSPEASRVKLIRRAYLDLTGLPPTPEEVEAFVNDESPRAYGDLPSRNKATKA